MPEQRQRVVFSHDIFTLQRRGGISRYFCELYAGLRQTAVCAKVSAPLHGNWHARDQGIGIFIGELAPERFRRAIFRLAGKFADAMALTADCAIFHKTYYSAALKVSRPVVLTVYDMIHERLPDMYSSSDPTSEWKRFWVDRADLVLAISDATRRDLHEIFAVPESKISVTHLSAGSDFFAAGIAPSPSVPVPRLLFIGTRSRYKNFGVLLKALALLDAEIRLLAIGGPPWSSEELLAMGRLGITSRVDRVAATDRELAALMRESLGMVLPSTYEGFGLPLVEAMASGCPAICSDIPVLREVGASAPLYFPPDDPVELANQIRHLSNPTIRETLRSAGKKRAEREFTRETLVSSTVSAYRTAGLL